MILRRAVSIGGVLLLGCALATAPVAIGPAAAAKHHPKHKSAHATSGFSAAGCSAVTKEQTQETGLVSGLEKAFESGNFTAIKAATLTEFNVLSADISKAESYLSGAPANVRAAFSTIAKAYNALKSEIQASTSLPQLEGAFTSLGQNQQLEVAGQVLASYFGTKCGITTPTS
jgi:hypothetical protein